MNAHIRQAGLVAIGAILTARDAARVPLASAAKAVTGQLGVCRALDARARTWEALRGGSFKDTEQELDEKYARLF